MIKTSKQTKKQIDRAQFQCERILDAAEKCFIEYGFHAASMANISKSAGMSVGLIYRYFESKNAIILAIIDRQLETMRNDFSNLNSDNDFIILIGDFLRDWQSGGNKGLNPALYLEMVAHATRDPQIQEAVTKFDRMGTVIFSDWLRKNAQAQGREVDEGNIQQCDFLVKCFIDGIAIRVITEPDLKLSFVIDSLKLLLPHMSLFNK
ncbi:MAG: TetR/AcrR family transcriptional regulator [Spongiibacteraceae bacterium]